MFVVRAFLKMRSLLGDKRELASQLAALEKELKQQLDVHEAAIVTILQRVMDIIDPPTRMDRAIGTGNSTLRSYRNLDRLPIRTLAKPHRSFV